MSPMRKSSLEPSGRVAREWGPQASGRIPLDGKTQSDRAVHLIHEDIVSGRMSPGERLKPEELKDRYGLGLSPIREALLRMTAEGLVTLEGQRGFQVPPASVEELQDIAWIRTELSCLALRRSIELGGHDWEASVVAAFHRMERFLPMVMADPEQHGQEWEERNRDFHAALESACRSPWLLHFNTVAFAQSERYRRRFVDYGLLLPAAQEEHARIMQAAIDRRADEACAFLTAHIAENMKVVVDCMTRPSSVPTKGGPKPDG